MIKKVFTVLLLVVLFGCGSTIDRMAGFGVISQEIEQFDNERVVRLSKSRTYSGDGWNQPITWLGAVWRSNNPDYVSLKLVALSYINFDAITVNIDGNKRRFEVPGQTIFNTGDSQDKSVALLPMPISYLKKMIDNDTTTIRVHTLSGYDDIIFNKEKGGGAEYARVRLKEFLAAI